MKTTTGLWIDHRKAIIAVVSSEVEKTTEITSGVDGQEHLAGAGESQQAQADDRRDRKFMGHLNQYYDEVIAAIRDAESILIFGPGEAKGELKKRLEHAGLEAHIAAIETADKMTDRQIVARVREYSHQSN